MQDESRKDKQSCETGVRQESEDYYSVFNSVNDAIFIHDVEDGTILDVNQKMLDMYKYENKEEIIGIFVDEFSSGRGPYRGNVAAKLVKKAVQGEPQLFEWQAKDKHGELFWVEVNLKKTVIDEKDRIIAVVRDITDRKLTQAVLQESESKFRAAFEGSHDAITLTAKDGGVIDCNRRALELYGLNSKDEFLKMRPADFSPLFQPDGRPSSKVSRELIDRVF